MVDHFNAADDLDRQVRSLESLQHAASVLRRVGSLEQADKEYGPRIAAREKALAEVDAKVAAAQGRLVEANQEAQRIVAKAHSDAEGIVAKALAKAGDVVGDGKRKAVEMISSAKEAEARGDVAAETVRVAQERVAALTAEAEALEARIAQARAEAKKLIGPIG